MQPPAESDGADPTLDNTLPPEVLAGVNNPPVSHEGVTCLATAALPTRHGEFQIAVVRVEESAEQALLLTHGDLAGAGPLLVRVHSECLTGEVLGSTRCDCGEQLEGALAAIGTAGRGALIYLYQEGRGIGLVNKIRAYALQDHGLDTVDANLALGLPVDGRDYHAAAAILHWQGISRVRLLTNNPAKCEGLERHDIQVVERVPLIISRNERNVSYLRAKVERMGHLLDLESPPARPSGRKRGPKDRVA
ncbi:MAG TPA: GTP cyclohydrolase II [Chloroflexota bacterium]|nr:GTP cyclohydrolase II [Chloroflexota bacterium]